MNRCDLKFEFSLKLSTFGYSNTNETVYFIEITGITDATSECKQNLNTQEKLNMRSLESRHTSSTLDHNLWIAYLDSSLKTCSWCSNLFSVSWGITIFKVVKVQAVSKCKIYFCGEFAWLHVDIIETFTRTTFLTEQHWARANRRHFGGKNMIPSSS